MSKKKVVVIGPCYPYRGGIATFIAHLCEGLSHDFEVELINYSMLYPSILFPGKTQYDESRSLTFSFPNKRLLSSLNPISWMNVAREIKKSQPDLIIMDWWNPFFALCFRGVYTFLPKSFKEKILIIAENVVSHEGRKIDAMLTRVGISIARSYLVLSDKVADEILPYADNKPVFKAHLPIYNAFNQGNPIAKNKDQFTLLFFGYIRKYKGLDIALEAMPEILKHIPHAHLLIVGECYGEWEEYQKIINDLELQKHITLVSEYVPNEAVGDYFHQADLVLLPYRSATQSGILNIAYGFDKPVVATNVGGFSEFIEDGKSGLLVQDVSAGAFAEGVIKWYQNHKDNDYVTAIRKIVNENGFGKISSIIQEVIK